MICIFCWTSQESQLKVFDEAMIEPLSENLVPVTT